MKNECYKIYHGDSIKILNQLPEKSVQLVFADPPYNLQLKKDLYRPNQTKVDGVNDEWDKFSSNQEYDKFTKDWLNGCKRVMADDATIWVIGSYHNIFRVGKIMMDLGFWILNDVQWYKNNPMPNFRGVRFTNATETLIWAKKSESQKKYTFNHKVMKQYNGGKQMTSVWQIPLCGGKERLKNDAGKKAHSTQKPEEILKRVILASSKKGDIVLDPFLGSGTTCAVAKKLARYSIGIEKEKEYITLCKKRMESIQPELFTKWIVEEPIKEKQFKVDMKKLIEKRYLKVSQKIYTKDKKQSATILSNGHIKNGIGQGSIHQMGAILKNRESCNGWYFWYYQSNSQLFLLNQLRENYRNQNGISRI